MTARKPRPAEAPQAMADTSLPSETTAPPPTATAVDSGGATALVLTCCGQRLFRPLVSLVARRLDGHGPGRLDVQQACYECPRCGQRWEPCDGAGLRLVAQGAEDQAER